MSTLPENTKVSKENLPGYLQEKGLEKLFYGIVMVLLGLKETSLLAKELNLSRTALYKKLNAVIRAILEVLEPAPAGRPKGPRTLEEARMTIFALKEENKALKQESRRLQKEHTLLQATHFFLQKQYDTLKEATMVELTLPYTRFTAGEKAHVLDLAAQFTSFGGTLEEFARLTGKCYRTLLTWSKVFKEQGIRGLKDGSTATSTPREIPKHIRKAVWKCHKKYPSWGGKQISFYLKDQKKIGVSKHQVHKILSEPEPEPEKKNRYTFGKKNMAVAMDYVELKVGELKAYLLLLVDDATRMITGFKLDFSTSTAQAVEAVKDCMDRHGKMLIIKSDNGKEFRKRFKRALSKMGIFHLNSPYYYAPFNGKAENVIGKLQRFLKFEPAARTLKELAAQINRFIYCYNHLMANEEIGFITPTRAWEEGFAIDPECEIIDVREDEKSLVLKFTNRKGNRARMELKMIA